MAWTDDRVVCEDGEIRGYVVHKTSDDRYGHYNHPDSNGVIRTKLALLVLATEGRAIFFLTLRAVHLASLYWIWGQAIPEALDHQKKDREFCWKEASLLEKIDLCKRVAFYSLKHLSWAILSLASFPINLALGAGCFLLSIPRPLSARRLFGQIEEAWSLPVYSPSLFATAMNFQAPCMQPKSFWEKYDLYQTDPYTRCDNLFKSFKPLEPVHDPI